MYSVQGTNAAIGATKSPLALTGGTGVVLCVTDFAFQSEGAPGTEAMVVGLARRQTAVGTGTATTPGVKSPGSHPAAETAALSELTAEPTYSAGQVARVAFNPRSRGFWQALSEKARLLTPLTANNGLGFQCNTVGGGTGILSVDCGFSEE
jgi:hypothetical protein